MSKNKSVYTKQQLTQSKRFTDAQKDVLRAVLDEGKQYTLEDAKKALEQFLKRRVK